ncbi:hypothetical protein [Geminocystis sp. NIES-3709]|uniref:hypothetical protein n=1 Tax=Geminocystis sp. NIES-3709 TaxID=1617448 RepID=UPI0005FCCB53|nr:hypothetical protein [Geminocystis sp. NIES-3709]BAQ65544.1 hypothetical protein GM3709_2309 [Geminocystis sp. NIES-3709]
MSKTFNNIDNVLSEISYELRHNDPENPIEFQSDEDFFSWILLVFIERDIEDMLLQRLSEEVSENEYVLEKKKLWREYLNSLDLLKEKINQHIK